MQVNPARGGAALDQFVDRLRSADPEAQNHDVAGQPLLDLPHPPILPATLDYEVIGRAHKDEEHHDPDRGDDHRLDHPRPIADRGDIAEPGGGDRDHGEIDHVEETDMPIDRIAQSVAIEPVDQHHRKDQRQRRAEPQGDIGPDRNLDLPAQRLERAAHHRRYFLGRYLAGSSGTRFLRTSKWSWGSLARPVWPTSPIRSPALTVSPSLTVNWDR